MQVAIYIDVIFFINLVMNLFILSITSFIAKSSTSFLRLLLSASTGSFFYCIIIYSADFYYYSNIFICFSMMALMTIICFKTHTARRFIRNCLFTYLIATVTGGICFYFYYLLRFEYFSFVLLIASSFVFFIIVKLFVGLIDVYILDRKKYCEIDVGINGRKYSLTALIDTGTYLKDDKSGHTVIIAEKKAFGNLNDCKKTLIPFRSLGNDEGILPAVYGQWAIRNKNTMKPVIIGLYDKKLSDSFNAIISPEAIGGCYENI